MTFRHPAADIVFPEDGSPEESGLFIIDLQGNAFVADELGRPTPALIPLPLYRPRLRIRDLAASGPSSQPSASPPSGARETGDCLDRPSAPTSAAVEPAREARVFDTWGLVDWQAPEQPKTSAFFQADACSLHVGSLVLPGRVEAAVSKGGGLVLVRRTLRQRRGRKTRPSPADEAALENCPGEPVWEIQAIVKEKVTFSERPTLHPRKKLFADRQESVGAGGKASSGPGHVRQTKLAETAASLASAPPSAEAMGGVSWLVGISPQLSSQRDGDWQLLAVDDELLTQIRSGDAMRLKGVPAPLLRADSEGEGPSRRQETLLCCGGAVYSVNRNEIDGQLLIAFRPREDDAGNGGSLGDDENPRMEVDAPPASLDAEKENALLGKTENAALRQSKVVGVPIVGLCKAILLLEPVVGRTTQIMSLLTLRPSPQTLDLFSACLEDKAVATVAVPRVPRQVSGDRKPASERFVLPASFFLQSVQASEEDLVAGLIGNQFSHSPLTAYWRRKRSEARARRASSAAVASASVPADATKGAATETAPPAFWGTAGFASSSSSILFLPACAGYCAVEVALLLGFFQRLLNFFAFLDLSSAEDLTVGHVFDLVVDMESKGFALFPFTTSTQTGDGSPSSSSSFLFVSGETEDGDAAKKARLPLDPGVLFQLLSRFCDLKLAGDAPQFPFYFFDFCPSLVPAASSEPQVTAERMAQMHAASLRERDTAEGDCGDADAAGCLKAYEEFLGDGDRVRACRVCVNWLKLHKMLALAVFYESGVSSRVQCGIDEVAYLPVHWMCLPAFAKALSEKLAGLPLLVCGEADKYLDACVADYRRFLRRREEARLEKLEQSKASSFVPHVDLEAQADRQLLEAAASVPLVRYALAKRAMEASDEERNAVDVSRSRGSSRSLPTLAGLDLLQANTSAFPELRLPADSAVWDDDIGSKVFAISDQDRKRVEASDSAPHFAGKAEKGASVHAGGAAFLSVRHSWRAKRGLQRDAETERVVRGLALYEEARKEAKKAVMAAHLAVLEGLAFYGEGCLVHVAEEKLPLETRERFAVLFMCKSTWWDSEIATFAAPTLLGKDLMETAAGPPRRYCEARQVVLNPSPDKEAKKDDVGVVFFSHNLPFSFWEV
ncbi:conserved hypothetical protein [Neospora caninum Liverpool]|uniref:Uncharacterized protein n=1 Tax=Neospora caninum (strain Liverpool) TaxID=572307 RepID=F0VA84_NEOCL|nr:conserved hypothetical protein [Neospora caninum Liverpool]CBZ50573.1 conserved hypothetical protein [Neospora caninum Liverpool]CEL65185.1 TPA: hypothetical protein BN1204_010420 [Neospora caninum Liverpool]|eukprot:XP_003880606.1 conserved hypothetical protein [Neospora caninum Liverpool]